MKKTPKMGEHTIMVQWYLFRQEFEESFHCQLFTNFIEYLKLKCK
jgi:hypothetical protein